MRHKYREDHMFAMDKTAYWFDMPSDTTILVTGPLSTPVKLTRHEKDNFTIISTDQADGMKMKTFVVFRGKGTKLNKVLQAIPGIVVHFSSNGWMSDSLTTNYLHSIHGQFSFHKCLLIWDAYR